MKRILILLFFILSLYQVSFSQYPPVWRYWNQEDGFDESRCSSILMLSNGSILINHNMSKQMSIYDGYKITKLPSPGYGLHISESSNGDIWTFDSEYRLFRLNGFKRFNWNNHEWKTTHVPKLRSQQFDNFLFRLIPIKDEKFIFATYDMIYEYDANINQIRTIASATETTVSRFYPLISHDKQNRFWLQGENNIVRLTLDSSSTKRNYSWELIQYPTFKNIGYPYYRQETINLKNEYFLGTSLKDSKGYALFELKNNQWKILYQHEKEAIHGGWRDTKDRLWIYGRPFKLIQDDKVIQIEGNDFLPAYPNDKLLLENNIFWLATSKGLIRYAPALWQEELYEYVPFINEDLKGDIWFGTDNKLIRFQNDNFETIPFPEKGIALPQIPNQLCLMSNNRLAIAGWIDLLIFNTETGECDLISHPSHLENDLCIRRTFPKNDHEIWILTQKRNSIRQFETLETFDGTRFKKLFDVSAIQDFPRSVVDIVQTKNGDIWIAHNEPEGPGVFQNGKFYLFSGDNGYPDIGAQSLLEIEDNVVWIGGRNGIQEYNGETWRTIRETGPVNFMRKARNEHILIATERGIYKYNHKSWVLNNRLDGLSSNSIKNIFEDSKGRLWASTQKSLCLYHPEADSDPPDTYIKDSENIKEIAPDGEARFVFSGIDKWKYTEAPRILYSYRINEGNWSPFTSETVASVTGLAAGKHSFHVRAMDRNWNIDESPAEWKFTVMPPWYMDPKILISIILTFNFLVYAINRHYKLRHSNQKLNVSNTQLNKMNAELQEANSQLLQLDQMKSAFVSQASHDLRTPLTAIKSSLDNLRRGVGGGINEKQDKVLDRALRSVTRLTYLVNDILDLNRIESGRTVLEKAETSFDALVHNVIHENQPASDHKRITLSAKGIDESCLLHIDTGKIERVVGELISNAIKYTPENGKITVSLQQNEDAVELSVQDSGIGITQDECNKIFDRFYRTQESQTMAKGSGLGLSIAKELVEMHDGTLSVSSKKGTGTTFTMTLPKFTTQGEENHA